MPRIRIGRVGLHSPEAPIRVSFVIPTMDRREDLLRLLDSLQAQSVEDFEIVVVDNASTDGTVAMLEGRDPRIRLVRNPRNVGAAAAKNQGIVASRGELVWFLDSDTELADPGVLERAITIMDADPRIGLAGARSRRVRTASCTTTSSASGPTARPTARRSPARSRIGTATTCPPATASRGGSC